MAALAAAIIGVICALAAWFGPGTATTGTFAVLSVTGWVLCGVITLVLIGVYMIQDNKIRAASFYVTNTTQTTLRWGALTLGLAGVVLTAIEIALWASKL